MNRRTGRYIWSAILFDEVEMTTTPQGFPIVNSGDFGAQAGSKEVTLMGIRGWLQLGQKDNGTVASTTYLGIVKKDDDESTSGASQDPSNIEFYIDEDILWTGGWYDPALATNVGNKPTGPYIEVNVKSRRKLKTGQAINLSVVNTTGVLVHLSGVLRAIMLSN